MTRITTITSGLEGVGKTQIAVNLTLELVRRGHFAGLFSDVDAFNALDSLLTLSAAGQVPQRRTDDIPSSDLVRRGYQGADLLGCRQQLDDWPGCDAGWLQNCIDDLDVREEYDDLLIDTSAMSAQAVLSCCLVAGTVLLVVTPDPASQAQAFALLRVLQLNGFSGSPRLIVNRADYAIDAREIQQSMQALTRKHLGLDLPFLETIIEDPHVAMAMQYRQAFTTVFPDTEASDSIVLIADQFEGALARAGRAAQRQAAIWSELYRLLARCMRLPGDAILQGSRSVVSD